MILFCPLILVNYYINWILKANINYIIILNPIPIINKQKFMLKFWKLNGWFLNNLYVKFLRIMHI